MTTKTFYETCEIDHGDVVTIVIVKDVPYDQDLVSVTIGRRDKQGVVEYNSQGHFFTKAEFTGLAAFFATVKGVI